MRRLEPPSVCESLGNWGLPAPSLFARAPARCFCFRIACVIHGLLPQELLGMFPGEKPVINGPAACNLTPQGHCTGVTGGGRDVPSLLLGHGGSCVCMPGAGRSRCVPVPSLSRCVFRSPA